MEQEDQIDHSQRHLIQPIAKVPHLVMPSQDLTQTFDFPSTISSEEAPSMSLIEVQNSIKNHSSTRSVSDRNTDQRRDKVLIEETLVKQDVLLDPQSSTYFFIKLTTNRIIMNDAQTYPLSETTVRFNESSFTLQNEYSELTLVVRSKEHKLEWLAAFQKVTNPSVDHKTEKQNIINKKRFEISQMKKLAKQPRQRSIKGAVFIVYETLTIVLLNVFRILYAIEFRPTNFLCSPCLWDTGPIWQLNNWAVVWTIISTLLINTEALIMFYFCRVKDPFKCAFYIQTLQVVMVLVQLAWCSFGLILAFNQFGFECVTNFNYKVAVLVVIAVDCTANIVNAIVGYSYILRFQVELGRNKAALMLETDRLQYELTGVEYNLTYSKTAGKCYVCGRLYDKEQVVEAACQKHDFKVVCHFTCLRELGAVECPN